MSKLIFNKINDYIKQSQENLAFINDIVFLKYRNYIYYHKIEIFTKILELVGEKEDKYYNEFFNNYLKDYKFKKIISINNFIDIINDYIYNDRIYNEIKNLLNILPKSILKDKYKKKSISLVLKKKVWDKYIGLEIGKSKCLCCNITDIIQMSFHCGHIIAESKGGETNLSNLKPICQNCNLSMGSQNMNDFMKTFI